MIEGLGTDKFWRFRLGIGLEHFAGGVEDYVLSPFGEAGYGKVRELIKHTSDAISFALEKGLEKAMNKCNTK